MACTPTGSVDVGGACHYGADGATTGYDDCRSGLVCQTSAATSGASGTCAAICDISSATSCTPSSTWTCSAYAGYFQAAGGSPTAGMCESQCNPLTQVRLSDGAAACGSPDLANPTRGCYGAPAGIAGRPSVFTCARAGPSNMTSDVVVTTPYLNSCAPGFIPLLTAGSGSTDAICVALCRPADTTLESHPTPGGQSPYSCADKGAGGSHECRYWWGMEADGASTSAWSNGLGYCMDYTKYTYSLGGPALTFPSCTTLSGTGHLFDPTFTDAAYWACVAR